MLPSLCRLLRWARCRPHQPCLLLPFLLLLLCYPQLHSPPTASPPHPLLPSPGSRIVLNKLGQPHMEQIGHPRQRSLRLRSKTPALPTDSTWVNQTLLTKILTIYLYSAFFVSSLPLTIHRTTGRPA